MKVLLRTRHVLPFIIVVLVGMLGLAAERLLVTHAAATIIVTSCPTEAMLMTDITNAGAGGTVLFNISSPCTIAITSTLTISQSVTLDNQGQQVTLDGGGTTQILNVSGAATTLTLNALTVANGSALLGGGLFNNLGSTVNIHNSIFDHNSASGSGGGLFTNVLSTVNITNSTFTNNSAPSGGGFFLNGGGVVTQGTVNIINSTFDHNSATNGGGFGNQGIVNVTNSTISNNSATIDGGGIGNAGVGPGTTQGTMNITNSTIANNSAGTEGGGLFNNDGSMVTITNSTFANNSAPSGSGGGIATHLTVPDVAQSIVANNSGGNCNSPVNDQGYNLSNDTSCSFTDPTSRQNINPQLDPAGLANNGGPTQTIALQSTSPAIDFIPATLCPSTDQRGFPRPDNGESACDIGAYEFQDPAPSAPSAPPSLLCQLHVGPVQAQVTGGQASGQADSSASSTTSTDENNGSSTNSNDATSGSTASATGGNASVQTGPIGISC